MGTARREFALAALLLAATACGGTEPQPPRANLVLISIDTLRPDRLGCYGHERPTSPQIDALAAQGLLFERAYAHSPRTAPSHMTLLTGLLPPAHGVVNFDQDGNTRLPDGVPTLASALSARGYRTVAITGGGNVKAVQGFDRGFDDFREIPHGPGAVEAGFDAAIAELERGRDGGLFLFLHTYAVHDPYVPPPEHAAPFLDPDYAGAIPSSPQALAAIAGPEWIDQHRAYWSRVDPASPADVQRLRDLYDGAIHHVDAELRRLVTRLEQSGQRRRTFLVITSDHGEEFGEHGGFQHGTLYEECLRVPLIFVPPPAARNAGFGFTARVGTSFGLVDLTPTLLDVLAVEPLPGLQGRSRRELLRGQPGGTPRLTASYPRRQLASLLVGDLKLIRDEARVESELFDLSSDPGERSNLAWQQHELHRDLLEQLQRAQAASRQILDAAGGAPPAPLDAETRRHLQALGYLDAPGEAVR